MNIKTPSGFIVKDAVWFTTMYGESIGIVSGETAEGKQKSYIGVGVSRVDEKSDILRVAIGGARFYGKARL